MRRKLVSALGLTLSGHFDRKSTSSNQVFLAGVTAHKLQETTREIGGLSAILADGPNERFWQVESRAQCDETNIQQTDMLQPAAILRPPFSVDKLFIEVKVE